VLSACEVRPSTVQPPLAFVCVCVCVCDGQKGEAFHGRVNEMYMICILQWRARTITWLQGCPVPSCWCP
jgi:hypothetical protein